MKTRYGFVSNSSSTSFVIEFTQNKEVTIKLPLTILLRIFDGGYCFPGDELTEEDIRNKDNDWTVTTDGNKTIVHGYFLSDGNGPGQVERLIKDQYGSLGNFFKENNIEVKEIYGE